jgi:hypothetical protein
MVMTQKRGPVIEHSDSTKFWYLNGVEVDERLIIKHNSNNITISKKDLENLLDVLNNITNLVK